MAKTDFRLTVKVFGREIVATSKTHMIDLKRVFEVGNSVRVNEGKPSLRLESWLASKTVKEYIALVSEKIGRPALQTTRGRTGTYMAHLLVALDAAAYLSPQLKYEIHSTFVENRILDVRNESADEFIDMNATLALTAQDVLGKDAHRGHFITLAKCIRRRVLGEDAQPGDWNTASTLQLRERARIEEALKTMLKVGVVRDWDHLKELAEKV